MSTLGIVNEDTESTTSSGDNQRNQDDDKTRCRSNEKKGNASPRETITRSERNTRRNTDQDFEYITFDRDCYQENVNTVNGDYNPKNFTKHQN